MKAGTVVDYLRFVAGKRPWRAQGSPVMFPLFPGLLTSNA